MRGDLRSCIRSRAVSVQVEAPVPEDMNALLRRTGFYEVLQGSTGFG